MTNKNHKRNVIESVAIVQNNMLGLFKESNEILYNSYNGNLTSIELRIKLDTLLIALSNAYNNVQEAAETVSLEANTLAIDSLTIPKEIAIKQGVNA